MTTEPGWYDDGSGHQRWWDGTQWGPYAHEFESDPPQARDERGIEQARKRMSYTLGSKREIRKLEELLQPDETVASMVGGSYGNKTGILVLTSFRLVFFSDGWTGSTHEDFPLTVVSSIGYSGGMMLASITIHASGNVTTITNVSKGDGKRFVDEARSALTSVKNSSPATAQPSAAADPMEQIRKLGDLRDAGLLTDEEFASKKQQLLDRM